MFSFQIVLFVIAFGILVANSRPVDSPRRRAPACRANRPSATPSAIGPALLVPAPSSLPAVTKEAAPIRPQPTAVATLPTSPNTLLGHLFPVGKSGPSWTTAADAPGSLPLSDTTLRPSNLLRTLSHDYLIGPGGKKSMKAHYPRGSYTFGHSPQGGLSFYAPGPSSVDLRTAKEATLAYSVYFPQGFGFQLGGKLPGLYGGDSDEEAVGCSGGRRSDACFSARLMWRANGAGEFYTYLPPYTEPPFAANKKQCTAIPNSECNPTYGASIGRGSFKFPTGKWTTVAERVRLNDVGKANGELELFVDGKSVMNISGLILRARGEGKIRGIQMQTFFGGSKPEYASPKDQDVFFSDFSVAITKTL